MGGDRGWVGKGWKNRCRNLSTRYFTTFCFQSEGRRCRGITRHRPYSTFMALNRDEVSTKLPSLPTFFLFSLPPSSPFLPSTLIRDSFSKRDGKWSLFDLSFRAGHSRIVARFSTIFQFEGRRIKFSEDRISVAERKNYRHDFQNAILASLDFFALCARTESFDHRPSLWKQITF